MIECPRCKHEHEPSGSHEDDKGEHTCDECGFRFDVEIEYEPTYSCSCVVHEYGEWQSRTGSSGEPLKCRFCIHCEACQIEE